MFLIAFLRKMRFLTKTSKNCQICAKIGASYFLKFFVRIKGGRIKVFLHLIIQTILDLLFVTFQQTREVQLKNGQSVVETFTLTVVVYFQRRLFCKN